ncbi:MaoC family dehydratase [Mycobacterium colombiense]
MYIVIQITDPYLEGESHVKVINGIDDAIAMVGQELGVSEWKEIDQKRIDAFAEVTEDLQWIHIDVDRASAESPYGTTIAHGFLTLSLIPVLSTQTYSVVNRKMGINYGLNKVRFLAPVTAGSRVRDRCEVIDTKRAAENIVDMTVRHTIELEGSEKPAAVAEVVTRLVF